MYFDDSEKNIIKLATIKSDDLEKFLTTIFYGDFLVIEKWASSSAQQLMYDIQIAREADITLTSIIRINPGNWKPVAKARQWTCRGAKTQHEKDAYFLAMYFFWSEFGKDIGDIT